LFHSRSFSRLSSASQSLVALMYPMKYSHVFIPILPSSLLEVLATPTPFIIGVNSIHEPEIVDLLDVIRVDLDGGAVTIPENMTVSMVPQPLLQRTLDELSFVLHPELAAADDAFPPPANRKDAANAGEAPTNNTVLDKQLRAVMLRLMTRLLGGYRTCLTLVRIHPAPTINFHKAAFLGAREFTSSAFFRRLLECMFFSTFVTERGPPWREVDTFDEAYAVASDHASLESHNGRVMRHIQLLAEELYRNECPARGQSHSLKVPQPAEGAMSRVHQPVFPHLDEDMVATIIHHTGLDRRKNECVERYSGILLQESLLCTRF